MANQISNQTIVVLALLLVLLVIGGTFLVAQQIRELAKGNRHYETSGRVTVFVVEAPKPVAAGGQVSVYVNAPNPPG